MEHKLKILPQYFQAVQEGTKTFEIRENDRGFKVGDTIILKEYGEVLNRFNSNIEKGYTGQEITKEITYILEGEQYGLVEGYCILGLKQEGIILRNIDLTGISKEEQNIKDIEEIEEFNDALIDYELNKTEENKIHLIEEFWDRVQTPLGLLEKEGIKAEEVMAAYPLHEKKLLNRPRKKECSKYNEKE